MWQIPSDIFGSITQAAMLEYQLQKKVTTTRPQIITQTIVSQITLPATAGIL
jgi:hypothetical protein